MPRGSYVESQAPSEGSGSYVEPQDQEGATPRGLLL